VLIFVFFIAEMKRIIVDLPHKGTLLPGGKSQTSGLKTHKTTTLCTETLID